MLAPTPNLEITVPVDVESQSEKTGTQTTTSNPSTGNDAGGVEPFSCWKWWDCDDSETMLICCLCISLAGVFFGIYYTIACIFGYEPCCCECCACCCYKKIYVEAQRERDEKLKKICKCIKNRVRTHAAPARSSPVCDCTCSFCKPGAVVPSQPSMEGFQSSAHTSNEFVWPTSSGHTTDTTTFAADSSSSAPSFTVTGTTDNETGYVYDY